MPSFVNFVANILCLLVIIILFCAEKIFSGDIQFFLCVVFFYIIIWHFTKDIFFWATFLWCDLSDGYFVGRSDRLVASWCADLSSSLLHLVALVLVRPFDAYFRQQPSISRCRSHNAWWRLRPPTIHKKHLPHEVRSSDSLPPFHIDADVTKVILF